MSQLRFSVVSCLVLLATACADGGSTLDGSTGGDGAMSTSDGGGRDAGRDAGPASCPTGQHRCGGGCIDDLENLPENGCQYGCGEACPAPPDGVASCDADGACAFGCEPPFTLVDGECRCTPRTCADMGAMCGAPDDGCGVALDCGACSGGGVCDGGLCSCPEDALEPNDSRLSVTTPLAAIPDVEDWDMTYSMWTLHDAGDEDWIRFHLEDSGVFDANPEIVITLDSIPPGSNYDLAAYYVCDSGNHNSSCSAGMDDNSIGHGCASASSTTTSEYLSIAADCDNPGSTDDAGTIWIHVTSRTFGGSCAPYSLRVHITS
jgi:hypothetical protein